MELHWPLDRRNRVMSDAGFEQREAAYQQAVEIIRAEWLAEGMTPEEWERSERVADLLAQALASGQEVGDVLDRWQGLTVEEIISEAERGGAPDDERLLEGASLSGSVQSSRMKSRG
jgi:hypothetical protein